MPALPHNLRAGLLDDDARDTAISPRRTPYPDIFSPINRVRRLANRAERARQKAKRVARMGGV